MVHSGGVTAIQFHQLAQQPPDNSAMIIVSAVEDPMIGSASLKRHT